jgi:hypothetical protein
MSISYKYESIDATDRLPLEVEQAAPTAPLETPLESRPWIVTCMMFVYFLIGTITFQYFEELDIFQSFYLSIITFTTVGYGDFSPKTPHMKVFTIFYICIGLMIIAQLVDTAFDYLVQKRLEQNKEKVLKAWFGRKDEEEEDNDPDEEATQASGMDDFPHNHFQWNLMRALAGTLLQIGAIVVVGASFYYLVDGFSIVDAFYFTMMTTSTVGYGDIVPSNDVSRAFTCLFSVFGTIGFGRAVSDFIDALTDQRLHEKHHRLLHRSALTEETLLNADLGKDKNLTREEFLLYRLKQMDMLDEDIVVEINHQFDLMDKDGNGTLDRRDIDLANKQLSIKGKKKLSNSFRKKYSMVKHRQV